MNLISDFHSNYKKLEEFVCVLVIITSGFFVSVMFKLNNFWTFPNLDEMLWHYRSDIFWSKILAFDFSGLIQSAQPGITVYWFTGFMMKFINFDFNDVLVRIAEKNAEGLDFNAAINSHNMLTYNTYQSISFVFNTPLFLLLVVFFISFYYLIKTIGFGRIIATFSLLFIVTNTYLQFWTTPSDKMLNIFMTLSFLTILVYLPKRENRKYLIVSAVLGSLAVLSKLSALFLLPFYFLIFLYYRWPLNKEKVKMILRDYFIWIFIFIITSIIFLPTIITNPIEIYNLFFSSVFEKNYSLNNYFFNIIFEYLKLFSLIVMVYITQSSILSFLLYIVLRCKNKYKGVYDIFPQKHLKVISAYIILFIIMVTVASSNHDVRFMSPAFVMFNILSAMGLFGLVETITTKNNINNYLKNVFYISIFFVAIISQVIFIILNGKLLEELLLKL